MDVSLLAHTRIVPLSPRHPLLRGAGTMQENLIEYAARICYRSEARMGENPDFIRARIREGHEDVAEHVRFVFRVEVPAADITALDTREIVERLFELMHLLALPGVYVSTYTCNSRGRFDGFGLIVSLSARHVRQMVAAAKGIWYDLAYAFLSYAASLTPSVFADIREFPRYTVRAPDYAGPTQHGNVTLLAFVPCEGVPEPEKHGAATFLVEGISRACSHQLVRHRLASFSQESQRYVSLEKGAWRPVVPPSIAGDEVARGILDDAWKELHVAYTRMRLRGIRKEDARFLLPNAAETRLVMTMAYPALRHFLKLRLDKAAQWEIREVARSVLQLVYPLAPDVFEPFTKEAL